MCGIFGVKGDIKNIPIDSVLRSIAHRGPDDLGTYKDKNILLGFRRLSIIDLSPKGHQPMMNKDGSVVIIFNGEIYNYLELKKELSHYSFRSGTDTEVLLHGYEEWGIEKLLKKINGMYAFAIYNKRHDELYLVRDRIGKKPLYYYQNGQYFAFASETKAFFSLKEFKFEIDSDMFELFMGFPYLPDNEKTILKHVHKVPPGSYIKISKNTVARHTYWHLPHSSSEPGFEKTVHNLEDLLNDSVKRRLIADVPVGVLLSGGLDSSLITAIASRHSSKKVQTITISFPQGGIDEREYAEMVAKHCGTKHTNITLNVANAYDSLKSNVDIYDDLSTTDSGLFSTYLLSQKVRELGVRVILVGEGADEIFAGYTWFQFAQYPFKLAPSNIQSMLYHYAIMRQLPGKKSAHYARILEQKLNETEGSILKKIQAYEIRYSLPNHYCMKVDKGSMAASIEARAPYMDYRIVEFARSMKDEYLLRGSLFNPIKSNEKYILRKIAEKYLPPQIQQRKKKGGMVPVNDLLQEGLSKDADMIIKNDYLREYYGADYLEKLITSQPNNKVLKWQREWTLWKCLLFALWYNHYHTV